MSPLKLLLFFFLFQASQGSHSSLEPRIPESTPYHPLCNRENLDRTLIQLQYLSYNCKLQFQDCCEANLFRHNSSIIQLEALNIEQVYCDQDTDGGGWLVILRRRKGKQNFFRKWNHYERGFGSLHRNFWFGLRNIHYFSLYAVELRVELERNGEKFFAHYDDFFVGNERTSFKLRVGGYRNESTLPDSLSHSNGSGFLTWDRDIGDAAVLNQYNSNNSCTFVFKDAWWHGASENESCTKVSLLKMLNWNNSEVPSGLIWERNGIKESFDTVEMKIRPKKWACGANQFDNYIIFLTAQEKEHPFFNPFWRGQD